MEEGKLTAMICGVAEAEKKEEKAEDKHNLVITNVLNYLHMKEGGHWQYGVCYVAAQVRFDVNIH